jgi:CRP/FNR family transcriptional regulator
MGRRAIGEHLALTMETVSRVLSDFQAHGWLDLPWREVRILDIEKLREIVSTGTAKVRHLSSPGESVARR